MKPSSKFSGNYFFLLALAILGSAFLTNCESLENNENNLNTCIDAEWGYEAENGPATWAELCSDFQPCDGAMQSPVDVASNIIVQDDSLSKLTFSYRPSRINVKHADHTLKYAYEEGSVLVFKGVEYQLKEMNFRSGSEHTLMGVQFLLEAQLIHEDNAGNVLAIAVFFETGADNAFLDHLVLNVPQEGGEPILSDLTYNAADLLNSSTGYYTYAGSMTSPPCTEGVTWIIMKNRMQGGRAQLAEITADLHGNARPAQPIGSRVIKEFTRN